MGRSRDSGDKSAGKPAAQGPPVDAGRARPGFSPRTLSFLRRLARNNDREWFRAHRDEYEAEVRGPMAAIVSALAVDLARVAPDMVADERVSLFRPWRDTRFSEDKSPLKTNVAAVFPHRRLGRMRGAGFYFEVAPRWVWIGGGLYAAGTAELHAVREHVAAHYDELRAVVTAPAFVKMFGALGGERLMRVPRGFDKDHPAADYLRHKQFLASREEAPALAAASDFYDTLVATFAAMSPLCRFLNTPLMALASAGPILDAEAGRGRNGARRRR